MMGMPNDVKMRLVVGAYVLADGSPAQGTVTFTPTVRLTDRPGAISPDYPDDDGDGDSGIVLPLPVKVTLTEGRLNVSLAVTDDEDLAHPGGWQYNVEEKIGGAGFTWTLEIPSSDEPLDLAAVSPGEA